MNADGSDQTRLTTAPGGATGNSDPTWSPDGRRIAFQHTPDVPQDWNYEIWAINADGTNQANLTNHPSQEYDPAWSPRN